MENRYIPVPLPTSWLSRLWTSAGSVPTSVEAARRAFVPGGGASNTENMLSFPVVIMLVAGAMILFHVTSPKKTMLKKEKMTVEEKYSPPTAYITHVDRAVNTLLKDQSMGAGLCLPVKHAGLDAPYKQTKTDFFNEALNHPGVRLVAHAVK